MYGIAVGRWPYVAVNRAGLTTIGAALLIGIGTLTPHDAWDAIDIPTIVILAGMMVICTVLEEDGLFAYLAFCLVRSIRSGLVLLGVLMLLCAVLSALFLNDTVVLLLTPFVIVLARQSGSDPLPYLLGIATSANIGSALTVTGNPQNIIIGNASGIGFVAFALQMAPVVFVSLFIAFCILWVTYRHTLTAFQPVVTQKSSPQLHWRGLFTIALLTLLLLLGVTPAVAVFCTAATTVIRRTTVPTQLIRSIDSELLVFFSSLFIVTAAFGQTQTATWLALQTNALLDGSLLRFGAIAAVLSNLVSNVPAVLILSRYIPAFPTPEPAWMMLAASSTLAGNTTLLASVANLIVAERAAQANISIRFATYARVGVPITILSLLVTGLWFLR
jgi:Na+/H+ antiporter NhaD/arsenite permease-like protein